MGLKFQEFATLIIFCFLSVFQRKRKPSSISLSTSSVNKNIRCFREGSNCEEKGFHIPFLLDYLKVVSRAAFWNSCSALREQSCVGRSCAEGSQAGTGLRLQLPLIVLRSQQCQVLREEKEKSGLQWKGSMKLFLPIGASSSGPQHTSWLARTSPGRQRGGRGQVPFLLVTWKSWQWCSAPVLKEDTQKDLSLCWRCS